MRRPHQPATSAHCCAAPATSPVCPPICREAKAVIARRADRAGEGGVERASRADCEKAERQGEDEGCSAGGGERRRREPPGRRAGAVAAGGVEQSERHERARARQGGDKDQRPGGARKAVRKRGRQRADAQDQREHERDRAKGADSAVAHHLELALARPAAAEPVRDIGEAVLMQRARRRDERRCGERSADQRRQAEPVSQRENAGADGADDRARDRRGPGGPVEIGRRGRLRRAGAGG